jgi:hypothetical protein
MPDQGATPSLLQAREELIDAVLEILAAWQPTMLVVPSPHDTHPDHNALAVLVNLALARLPAGPQVRLIHYLVHRRAGHLPTPRWTLRLSAGERVSKRRAILEHGTQMALSRKRFVAYAKAVEHYYPPEAIDPTHPIRHVGWEDGALRVCIQPSGIPAGHGELFVAFESPLYGNVRWRVALQSRSGIVRIQDATTGNPLRKATIRCERRIREVRLPLSSMLPVQRIALKFDRRIAFYDEAGWCEYAMPVIDHTLCSAILPSATSRSSSLSAPSFFGGVSEALG